MQMVSTAKLSQIQKHSVSYQVYASKIRSVITHLAQSHLLDSASVSETGKDQAGKLNTLGMLKQRPVKKTGIVVVTSDRGLVGSYNSNVIKQTLDLIKENGHTKDDVVIIAVGGTGLNFSANVVTTLRMNFAVSKTYRHLEKCVRSLKLS